MKTILTLIVLLLTTSLFSQQRSRTYWDNAKTTIAPVTGMNSADQKISLDTIREPQTTIAIFNSEQYYRITPPKQYSLVCYGDSVMIVDGVIKKYDKNYIQYYNGRITATTEPGYILNNKAITAPYKETDLSEILQGSATNTTKDTIPNAICVATGWSMGTLSGRTLVSYENKTGIGTISGLDRYGNVDRRNIREQTTALLRQKGIKKIIINLER